MYITPIYTILKFVQMEQKLRTRMKQQLSKQNLIYCNMIDLRKKHLDKSHFIFFISLVLFRTVSYLIKVNSKTLFPTYIINI